RGVTMRERLLIAARCAGTMGCALLIAWVSSPTAAAPQFAASFVSSNVGNRPDSVAIGDLNVDGKPDVVTANLNDSTVSVLLGNGDATFGAKTDYAAGSSPNSVAIGDLNGDGKPDLATANFVGNTVSVLLGNGDGTFGARRDYFAGSGAASVAIG